MKTIVSIVSRIMLVFIMLFVSLLLLAEPLFGIVPGIVLSGSMEPEIQTGSLSFVNKRTSYEDIRKGDIIAFETSLGTVVTHRVICVTDSGLETKGDANEISDGITTTEDNLKGKYLFRIPYLGYCVDKLQSASGKAMLTVLLLLLIIADAVAGEKAEKEKAAERMAEEKRQRRKRCMYNR